MSEMMMMVLLQILGGLQGDVAGVDDDDEVVMTTGQHCQ